MNYTNPIYDLRKEQLAVINSGVNNEPVLRKIFKTIPRNFRKIYMGYADYNKAIENKTNENMRKEIRNCLEYCLEIIG